MDAAGPIAKTPYGLASLLDVLRDESASGDKEPLYTSVLDQTWAELSIGALDYEQWIFPPEFMKPEETATAQMVKYPIVREALDG